MKAIVQKAYGSPEVLELTEIEGPGSGIATCQFAFTRPASIEGTGS